MLEVLPQEVAGGRLVCPNFCAQPGLVVGLGAIAQQDPLPG